MIPTYATSPGRAYRALSAAADAIGRNNFERHLAIPASRRPATYSPTEAHRDVVQAMLDVMNGRCTPEQAMALLHRSDVEAERFSDSWRLDNRSRV